MAPPIKHNSVRQRRNNKSTKTTLTLVQANPDAWQLRDRPDGQPWHEFALETFDQIVEDFGSELIESDYWQLLLLCDLVHEYWNGDRKLASEIRLQRQCFGVTPLDRARLHWEIARGEEAADATDRRRREKAAESAPRAVEADDPRDILAG